MKRKLLLVILIIITIVLGRYAIGKLEYQAENRVTEIFIIRGLGSSYMDFNLKFFLVISLIAIIIYDWRKSQRLDYFLIALVCASATPVEAYVQLTGRRVIQTSYLFGMELPYLLQLTIQSLADSSFDVVLMLFFADRILKEKTRKNATLGFILVTVLWLAILFSNGIQTPNYGGEVASRRVISGTGELAVVLIVTFIVLLFFSTENKYLLATPSDKDKKRGLYLLYLLILYGAIGTIGMYLSGQRWIEIGFLGSTQHAPLLVELAGFAFNFTFEYAFTYTLSYTVAVGLKLIRAIK